MANENRLKYRKESSEKFDHPDHRVSWIPIGSQRERINNKCRSISFMEELRNKGYWLSDELIDAAKRLARE